VHSTHLPALTPFVEHCFNANKLQSSSIAHGTQTLLVQIGVEPAQSALDAHLTHAPLFMSHTF